MRFSFFISRISQNPIDLLLKLYFNDEKKKYLRTNMSYQLNLLVLSSTLWEALTHEERQLMDDASKVRVGSGDFSHETW